MADEAVGSVTSASALGEQRDVEAWRSAAAGEPPAHALVKPAANILAESIKDAVVAALVAGTLGFFFLGLRTEIGVGRLEMTTRWTFLIWAVAIVFAGRLALNLLIFKNPRPVPVRLIAKFVEGTAELFSFVKSIEMQLSFVSALRLLLALAVKRFLAPALLVTALILPFLVIEFTPARGRQFLDLAILILTYIMLGWGLNIVVGLAGLLDLGYVAFYAVGAYSFALLDLHTGLGFWICLPLAGILAAFWGIILGFPVLRLRGDYLAIVTLAFGEIIRIILINWKEFTGGPNGINNITKPSFFGLEFTREGGFAEFFGLGYSSIHRFIWLYYIILALALLTSFVTHRLRRLPIGRAWEALREDEIACRSLGINTRNTKLTAFAIGAMFGGFAGSFFATRQGFISPESFSFIESATILAIVVLGGLGSQLGVVIAAIAMIGGIEVLRNLGFLKEIFGPTFEPAHYRMLIFGLAMVMIMVWKPRGLITSRVPSAALKEKKRVGAEFVHQGRGG
ncbi:MAG: high-affinity branched-chain amino acid ABC transporter permease LivM [Propylenella sp.]